MKLIVVGTRGDVAGFRLAGIRGVVCSTREEARREIARVAEDALIIVSAQFAAIVPRERLFIELPEEP